MLEASDIEHEDAAPIEMIEAYFAAHGWEHETGEDEVTGYVKGSWTKYELRALWRADDSVLQFLAFPDIRVADDRRGAIYEAIGLINEQLWIGHFEMWSSSGIVLYRHAAMVGGGDAGDDGEAGATLTLAQAETLIESAIDECERFYPVFQFVLWGGKSPKDALAAALVDTQGEA